MGKVEIEYRRGDEECDACGPYEWDNLTVSLDGELVYLDAGDSHLCGGLVRDTDPTVLLTHVLRRLGFDAHLDTSTVEMAGDCRCTDDGEEPEPVELPGSYDFEDFQHEDAFYRSRWEA